jgi:hypothetical protein
MIGNHLFSQKRDAFMCNKFQFFLVSFPKHLYCSPRSLILDTSLFNWCSVQILSKMSGKLIITVLYRCLLGYITQHFSWMYKIHVFRNVIPWNLVDTDVLEKPAVAFYQAELLFYLKLEASSLYQDWYMFKKLHGVTSQNIALLRVTTVRISDRSCSGIALSTQYIWKGSTRFSIAWRHSSFHVMWFYGQFS